MNNPSVLLAEKNPDLERRIKAALHDEGFGVVAIRSKKRLSSFFSKARPRLLITSSTWEEEGDGLTMVEALLQIDRQLPIILTAEQSSEQLVLAALKIGVKDYFKVPFSFPEMVASVRRCLEERCLDTLMEYDSELAGVDKRVIMIGDSPAMQEVKSYIRKAAQTDSAVMITGETGTGKELAAELLHGCSRRRDKPLLCVNCAALPENLVESELFGFEKGAFTGAVRTSPGKFEQAAGGTIFLDEIGDMSLYAQAKILRAIETKKISRVGGEGEVAVDIRGVAATNQNPEQLVAEKKFREDLFYRLNVARIHLPPLRERKEDISNLVNYYICKLNKTIGSSVRSFNDDSWQHLFQYDWPGNVRELKNVVESSFIDLPSRSIDFIKLPEYLKRKIEQPLKFVTSERDKLLAVLMSTRWNKSKAAAKLNWSRMTLYRKLKKYEIGVNSPVA